MKNLHIFVEGDVNDGDYINQTTDISDLTKEEIEIIYDKLSNYNPEEDDFDDDLWEYLPSLDNNELHTITDIKFYIMKEIELKDIK